MRRIITLLVCRYKLARNAWALREIDPLHPDLPGLLSESWALQDRWETLIK